MTIVVAHRGASADEPEHSLAAYQLAIDVGADAVECDVRLTRDGHLVLVHDATLARTSNGGRRMVSAMTLAELERFDFDRRRGEAEPPRRNGTWSDPLDEARARILTLPRLLQALMAAPYPISISIETKHPNRYGGAVEAATQRVLAQTGFPRDRVRVMSFSGAALVRMKSVAQDLPLVYLVESTARRAVRNREPQVLRLPGGATTLGPGLHLIKRDRGLVRRMHDSGHRVHVWTVDAPGDVELCVSLGVDAIITNRPARVLAQLGR